MTKSTHTNSDRQAPRSHEPQFFARDFRIPIDVIQMVQDGTLTATHALLFGYIDLMVNWKGAGCWASNRCLAGLIGKKVRQTQTLIKDGIRLGLLRVVGTTMINKHETRRVLETAWSRVTEQSHRPMQSTAPPPMQPTAPNINPIRIKNNSVRSPQPPPASSDDADGVDPSPLPEALMPEPTWGGTSSQRAVTHPTVVSNQFQWADQLIEAAKAAHKVRIVSRIRSAASFAGLLRRLGGDEARLQRALDWYCSRGITGEYAVQAWCGESFARKFDQVEAAMTRDQSRRPDLVISPEAQNVVAQLTITHTWPDEKELATVVQSSLNTLNDLKAKLVRMTFPEPSPKWTRVDTFRKHLLKSDELVDPGWFVFNWLKGLRKWIYRTRFDGRLLPLSVRLDNERFVTHMRDLAAKFHDSTLWDELTEAIK